MRPFHNIFPLLVFFAASAFQVGCGTRYIPEELEDLPPVTAQSDLGALEVWMSNSEPGSASLVSRGETAGSTVSVLHSNRMELLLGNFGLTQAEAFLDLTGDGYNYRDAFLPFEFGHPDGTTSLVFENDFLPDGAYTHFRIELDAIKFTLPVCYKDETGANCSAKQAEVIVYLSETISQAKNGERYEFTSHQAGDMVVSIEDSGQWNLQMSALFESNQIPDANWSLELAEPLRVENNSFVERIYQISWETSNGLPFYDADGDNRLKVQFDGESLYFHERLEKMPSHAFRLHEPEQF